MQPLVICYHVNKIPNILEVAEVVVESPDRRPVRAVADGRAVERARRVRIAFAGERVRLAYLPPHDFTRQMLAKIVRP